MRYADQTILAGVAESQYHTRFREFVNAGVKENDQRMYEDYSWAEANTSRRISSASAVWAEGPERM